MDITEQAVTLATVLVTLTNRKIKLSGQLLHIHNSFVSCEQNQVTLTVELGATPEPEHNQCDCPKCQILRSQPPIPAGLAAAVATLILKGQFLNIALDSSFRSPDGQHTVKLTNTTENKHSSATAPTMVAAVTAAVASLLPKP